MKKKIVIKVMIVVAFFLIPVTLFKSKVLNSKADKSIVTQKEVKKDDAAYKKFIEEYRIDGVEISILSLDNLYNEFNKYENIDNPLRKKILAKASDEVIIQFLLKEQSELFELSSKIQANDIHSKISKEDITNDKIEKVDIDYYVKGSDSQRKVTKITNKFGGTMTITSTDEKENDMTKYDYRHVQTLRNEQTWKEYGDRYFSVSYNSPLFTTTVKFQYTLHWGSIETRNIILEDAALLPGLVSLQQGVANIDKSKSSNINDYVSGYVTIKATAASAFWGGLNAGTYKITMKVIQGKDQGHTSKPKMQITQKSELYEKPLG